MTTDYRNYQGPNPAETFRRNTSAGSLTATSYGTPTTVTGPPTCGQASPAQQAELDQDAALTAAGLYAGIPSYAEAAATDVRDARWAAEAADRFLAGHFSVSVVNGQAPEVF